MNEIKIDLRDIEKIINAINEEAELLARELDLIEVPSRDEIIEQMYKKIIKDLKIKSIQYFIPHKDLTFKKEKDIIQFKLDKLLNDIEENKDDFSVKLNLILKFLEEFEEIPEEDRPVLANSFSEMDTDKIRDAIKDLLKSLKLI
ncbi:MAG: hypothetical protein ACTSRZ_02795 [Promethearchaeota archaeon]